MTRAKSVSEILSMNLKTFDFEGKWFDAFDIPERKGIWFIWGNSGNGKTSFTMQLAKYLCHFCKVAYDSLEEGAGLTMQNNMKMYNMMDVNRKFQLLDNEPMDELSKRLKRKKSPDVVIIDSFQYTHMTYKQYTDFKEAHKDKLIIFISHANGKMPSGNSAKSVMYDASLKIWVEGYRAFSKGRFIGKKGVYDIWPDGSLKCWGTEI